MTKQVINIGTTSNDGKGDPLRIAFEKINNNFAELYNGSKAAGPDWAVQYRAAANITDAAVLGGQYVAIGNPNRVFLSPDASTWEVSSTQTSNDLTGIIADTLLNQFVAVGTKGAIETSPDGQTWTVQTTGITDDLLDIAYNNNATSPLYVAVGANGQIVTSTDTVTWTPQVSGIATTLRGVSWNPLQSAWTAVGDGGEILVSLNGTAWASQFTGTTEDLQAIATTTDGATTMVVGTNGVLLNSADLITWNLGVSGTTNKLTGITFVDVTTATATDTYAFAVGLGGTIISSLDYATWDATTYPVPAVDGTPFADDLYNIVNAGGLLIAMGYNGAIIELLDGVLTLDSISAGVSGSSKFLFNEQANTISVATDILPQTTNTWALGSNAQYWGNVWVDGNDGLHVGLVDIATGLNTVTLHETGNSANISDLVVKDITANTITTTGNVTFVNMTVTGNADINNIRANTANIIDLESANANIGNIVTETITANGNIDANNFNAVNDFFGNNITLVSNVTAAFLKGDGGFITNIAAAVGPLGAVQLSDGNKNFTYDANVMFDAVTGNFTAPQFVGNLVGEVTGNVTGNLTGEVTGNVVGNLVGNVTGNIVGTYGNFVDVNASNALIAPTLQVTDVTAFDVTASNALTTPKVIATDVSATTANIATLVAPTLTSTTATLTNATIATLGANVLNSNTFSANNATVNNLAATVANIPTLTANALTANTVTANTTTSGVVAANTITAAVSVTAPSFVGSLNGNVDGGYINVSGNVDAGNVNAINGIYGELTGNVSGNLTGDSVTVNQVTTVALTSSTVTAQTLTGNVVATAATIGNATITGNVSATNITATANVQAVTVTATNLKGNLVGNVNGNVVGNLAADHITVSGLSTLDTITGSDLTLTGDIQAQNAQFLVANVSAINASGKIETLGNVVANIVTANLFTGVLTTAVQPNITTVGTLDDLRVAGNANLNKVYSNSLSVANTVTAGDVVIAGNLHVAGDVTYTSVANFTVQSPIIDIGGGPNGSALTSNDGLDRGLVQHYFAGTPQTAYMGWKNDEGQMVFAAEATVTGDVVTVSQLANISAANATLDNITANTLTLSGDLNLDDITADQIIASNLIGDGSGITGLNVMNLIAGPNVSLTQVGGDWTIAASLPAVAGLIDHAVQFALADGNLTSSADFVFYSANSTMIIDGNAYANDFYGNLNGTLYGNVDGNTATFSGAVDALSFNGEFNGNLAGNVTGNIEGDHANFSANVDTYDLNVANLATVGNITGTGANFATIAGGLTTPAQPNITQVGSLINLTVSGNASLGNVIDANLVSANYLHGVLDATSNSQPNITDVGSLYQLDVLGNITAGNVDGGNLVVASYLEGTLTTNSNAQPNITSVGTLIDLTVTGNVDSGNVNTGSASLDDDLYVGGNATVIGNVDVGNLVIGGQTDLGNIRIESSNITEVGNGFAYTFNIASQHAPMVISVPNGTVTNVDGVSMTLTTGHAIGNATGGALNLTTGNGQFANAGAINILSGHGEDVGTLGGQINIIAGNTIGSPLTTNGANIYIQSGHSTDEDAGAVIIQGGNATGAYLFGGNVYITPGLGDSANNANYDGRVIIGKAQHQWPNQDGNANAVLITDGSGKLSWLSGANGSSIFGGGFNNIMVNGNVLLSNTSSKLSLSAANVQTIHGNITTVGLSVIASNANTQASQIQFRVTPTGIPIDNPFSANIDMSTTGNSLGDDFAKLGEEVGSDWTWDLAKNPVAGLQRFDLGMLP